MKIAALSALLSLGRTLAAQPPPAPRVTAVEGNLELDDLVQVQVEGLSLWAETHDPHRLVPYLNGLALAGNHPDEVSPSRNRLQFHLRITPENRKVWVDLLGAPKGLSHPVTVSVGLEGQPAFDTAFDEAHPKRLTVISPAYGAVALLVVLATAALLLRWARTTSLIREPGPRAPGAKPRPYNLGRAQMAFWFFLVYASYLAIWLVTGALDTITPSLLGLMGISAGTALGEALIDADRAAAQGARLQELAAEREALAGDTGGQARLAQVDQEMRALGPSGPARASLGFLRDLLGDGYSIHRFQIFAWTIALGILFVAEVYNSLAMPEFSPTLLALMGVSSGTYLGFKFPERA